MADFPRPTSAFRVLFGVFYARIVDVESLAESGDPQRIAGQVAAILVVISMVLTVEIMFVSRAPAPLFLWTMQHLLLSLNMTTTGLLAVLNWEAALPDRHDLMVLGALPLPMRTIYAAKLSALATTIAGAMVMTNLFTGLSWPFLFASPSAGLLGVARSFLSYWFSMAFSAAFPLCAVTALQGVASLLLPRQLFLRASSLLQLCAFVTVAGTFLFEPSLADPAHQEILLRLPSYWFLGLLQELNGTAMPWSAALAVRACGWLGGTLALAAGTLLLSYLRTSRQTLEQPELLPLRLPRWMNSGHRTHMYGGISLAISRFTLRSLMRSRQHRILLALCIGVGLAVVAGMVFNPFSADNSSWREAAATLSPRMLAVSMLLIALVAAAVRVVSSIPVALRAQWVFRVAETEAHDAYLRAVRMAVLCIGVLPIWLLFAALFFTQAHWMPATAHMFLLALEGLLVVEISLSASLKIPFTCAWRPGKAQLAFSFWGVSIVALAVAMQLAEWESIALASGSRFLFAVLALCAAWAIVFISGRQRRTADEGVAFTDEEAEQVISLRLGGL